MDILDKYCSLKTFISVIILSFFPFLHKCKNAPKKNHLREIYIFK